jgi:hypothetical protein
MEMPGGTVRAAGFRKFTLEPTSDWMTAGNSQLDNSVPACCSLSEDWRFVDAVGKVEFELFRTSTGQVG